MITSKLFATAKLYVIWYPHLSKLLVGQYIGWGLGEG